MNNFVKRIKTEWSGNNNIPINGWCSWYKHTFFLVNVLSNLGNKNEDECVTIAVKLGCPILTKKMDHITADAMLQE